MLNGISIDRGYDSAHRLRHIATDAGYSATYLFDSAGRLSQIAESHHRADFGYEPCTEILDSVEIRRVGIERLRHERSIDKLGRIEWMKTVVDPGSAGTVRRDYTYNSANQRTIIEHEDGRAWHYGYDELGQVIFAHKRLSADPQSAILPGYSFGSAFDDIGSRETATRKRFRPSPHCSPIWTSALNLPTTFRDAGFRKLSKNGISLPPPSKPRKTSVSFMMVGI